MTYTVELVDCLEMMRRVAREVKTRHSVDDNVVIWPYITQEHGITIRYGNLLRDPVERTVVTFPSKEFYTFLMLKYS
jgi:hypothetical protein